VNRKLWSGSGRGILEVPEGTEKSRGACEASRRIFGSMFPVYKPEESACVTACPVPEFVVFVLLVAFQIARVNCVFCPPCY
jgi:hypothetical protein